MTKKEIALEFLTLTAKGDAKIAFEKYIHQNFIHHNAYFKGDAHTIMLAMEESAVENPNKIFEVQRALQDGDMVAVHSRVRQNPNDADIAVVHIFKFENDKISEMWDIGQFAPEIQINENGIF